MKAAVASANNTSGFRLSMDGKDITDTIAVPKATTGEDNYDEYNVVEAEVSLTEGEHILRFTVTGDWMDIDYIEFAEPGSSTEPGPGTDAIRQVMPTVRGDATAPRLVKKGNTLFVEKNGMRFDLTGHRLR
jgi:alpha-galactosidase